MISRTITLCKALLLIKNGDTYEQKEEWVPELYCNTKKISKFIPGVKVLDIQIISKDEVLYKMELVDFIKHAIKGENNEINE